MVDVPGLPDEERATLAPVAAAYVAALEAAVMDLRAENTALRARVDALEARMRQDSTNSSRPPSSDPPRRSASPPAVRGMRRPGGQPGHRGTFRALLPPERVDHVQYLAPPVCHGCGDPLPAAAAATDPPDVRHQVVEIPRVRAVVTDYHLAARRCGRCGHLTRAAVPATVPRGAFGPVLQAAITLLTGRYRLAKREAADCLATLFEVPVAVGSVSASEQAMSTALAPSVAAATAAAQQAPVANLDETGWRQGRQRAWLWTMVTATTTVFRIDRHRSGAVVQDLLGPTWAGIVGSDRYPAYKRLPLAQRQVCWAHARRDFQRLVDDGPGPRPVGVRLLAITAQVFELWHRLGAGEVGRADLQALVGRAAVEMAAVLAAGAERGHPLAQTLCREDQAVWPALWTFIMVDGVEPTNNAAEQALRPAVLWRKGSFGTHSEAGSRFVERMLTVSATCRRHGRDLLAFLVEALTAAQRGTAPPSLLPALST